MKQGLSECVGPFGLHQSITDGGRWGPYESIYFSSRGWASKRKVLADRVSGSLSLACPRSLRTVLAWQRDKELWFLLSLPGRHSHHGGPTHWTSSPPNHLPWAPQPIPPHGVGAGALSYGLGGGCSVHSTKWISCYGGPRSGHTCPSGQCHGNTQTDAVECLYFFHGGFVPAHKMRQKPKPDKQKGSINC